MKRREWLRTSLGVVAGAAAARAQSNAPSGPADSAFWSGIASQYEVDRAVTNLENAYWGVMAKPVEDAYIERVRFVNRTNVVYVRDAWRSSVFSEDLARARASVASAFGCGAPEIALTRSGTEALQNLIINYKRVSARDSVLYADLDFDAMQFAMDALAQRRGARVVRFYIPEPATHANILEIYERMLSTTTRPKLLLLTHISHRTGLVMPIAAIASMARQFGVDVIVDAAQSWGQIDFQVSDLKADFVGGSLHKWMGAPLGTGFLYVKADRLHDIDPHLANRDFPADDIRARVLTGTSDFAAQLTVPDALRFQAGIGAAPKEARLRYLRDYWTAAVNGIGDLEILTPDDPALHAAITSFRFRGKGSSEEVRRLQQTLAGKYRILTAARKGIARGDAIRVTPSLYNTESELDRLVAALHEINRTL